jgi:hypothetical protein
MSEEGHKLMFIKSDICPSVSAPAALWLPLLSYAKLLPTTTWTAAPKIAIGEYKETDEYVKYSILVFWYYR